MSKSCSGKVNKTRYNDLGKLMKQTSFTVKKPGGKPSQKTIHYNKKEVSNLEQNIYS